MIAAVAACSGSSSQPSAAGPTPVGDTAVDLSGVPAFTLGVCGGSADDSGEPTPCDPVNLVFPATGFATVVSGLLANGWSLIGIGSPEYVQPPGTTELLPPSIQLFETQGEGATSTRFHVRLWQLANGETVGAVHHERGTIDHQIDRDWEAAEGEVISALCKDGAVCSEGGIIAAQRQQQDGTDRWRGFRNDWRPAVIRLA
jgi:hypothetical protein